MLVSEAKQGADSGGLTEVSDEAALGQGSD